MTGAQARQEIATLEPRIAAGRDTVASARTAVLDGDNPQILVAAEKNLQPLLDRYKLLIEGLPELDKRDAAEAGAARTEEERRRADAEAAARKASFKGAQTDLANWRRAAADVPAACDALAAALAAMNKAASSYEAKIPEVADLPACDEYRRFAVRTFKDLIAGELHRAGEAAGVELPGAQEHAQ
jgi:hypothetical protein